MPACATQPVRKACVSVNPGSCAERATEIEGRSAHHGLMYNCHANLPNSCAHSADVLDGAARLGSGAHILGCYLFACIRMCRQVHDNSVIVYKGRAISGVGMQCKHIEGFSNVKGGFSTLVTDRRTTLTNTCFDSDIVSKGGGRRPHHSCGHISFHGTDSLVLAKRI